ncbi:MAG TPA: AAA family ATPase [Burkholderiales bacterium]|nr:AAA family ATPase [Burkholderiales bacterium]
MSRAADEVLQERRAECHRDLIRALLDPACYPHSVRKVEHIETHISDVLLTGAYAYKLKKPLDLGFLDFSTLEKRRLYCEEELRLNRRLAPDLYLEVVPLTGQPTAPRIGGEGEPFEYAVKMRQFDQAGILERVLARGELTAAHADEAAELLAQFHAALPPASADSLYGRAKSVMSPALQNFDQLVPLVQTERDRELLIRLREWTQGQHAQLQGVFEERHREGFVRECHGDLHLGNMVLIDGRVRVFDCIEFNPLLRWIDVMNETAFLAMDLIQRGRSDLAFRFLNRYLEISGDYAGVRLLRYYMVYRALVRAKVAAIRAAQDDIAPASTPALRAKCSAHLVLAKQLIDAATPVLAIFHGLSGSGKTRVSQIVLQTVGAIRVRSDIERKRLHGFTAVAHTGSAVGQGVYTDSASVATYDRLAELAGCIVEARFPVLVDATFLQRAQRQRFRALAEQVGVPFIILHTEASEAELRRRINLRANEASDASEATDAVLDRQLGQQEPLDTRELSSMWTIDTQRMNERDIAEQARQQLQDLGAEHTLTH